MTGQFSAVDNLLTGRENVLLMADLHHLDRRVARLRSQELLDRFDLVAAAGQMAATYSGGIRRLMAFTGRRKSDITLIDAGRAGVAGHRRQSDGGTNREREPAKHAG